mmetsp:Transcript_31364/g.45923  ORF Transcript_31364/g.45923 Transcript_31364/m.45923 type:complete len:96 (-) Transcript_31364:296-583(-)
MKEELVSSQHHCKEKGVHSEQQASKEDKHQQGGGFGSRSLLAGIGEQLATGGGISKLPSDVARVESLNRKEMLSENFRDFAPGYTGQRKPTGNYI